MSRFFEERIPRFKHNKMGFESVFEKIIKLDTIIVPLFVTKAESVSLVGNFPYNIEKWIWSSLDPPYLICRLTNGAYVFFTGKSTNMKVIVTATFKELIQYGLDEDEYNLYINNTYSSDMVKIFPHLVE